MEVTGILISILTILVFLLIGLIIIGLFVYFTTCAYKCMSVFEFLKIFLNPVIYLTKDRRCRKGCLKDRKDKTNSKKRQDD